MTWTYNGDPAGGDLDRYRFEIGDTDPDMPILQDEEINYILDRYPDENTRLYQMYSKAATMLTRDIKRSLGPSSEDPTTRQSHYAKMANIYKKACIATVPSSAKPVKSSFRKGIHDNV